MWLCLSNQVTNLIFQVFLYCGIIRLFYDLLVEFCCCQKVSLQKCLTRLLDFDIYSHFSVWKRSIQSNFSGSIKFVIRQTFRGIIIGVCVLEKRYFLWIKIIFSLYYCGLKVSQASKIFENIFKVLKKNFEILLFLRY